MSFLAGALGGGSWLSSLLGIGLMGASMYATNSMLKNQQRQQQANLQQLQDSNSVSLEALPEIPQAPTGNAADAATNPAEEARRQQLAALEENDRATNPTGGLGILGAANVGGRRRTLGGS